MQFVGAMYQRKMNIIVCKYYTEGRAVSKTTSNEPLSLRSLLIDLNSASIHIVDLLVLWQ